MKNVLLWELRQRRLAIFWWCVGTAVLTVVILMLYPSIRHQAEQLNQALNQLPKGVRELKTGASSTVDVADPVGFLNSQLFYATLPILWIILSITRGSGVLGRDEQLHTLELTLARPISRSRLLLGKVLSLLIELCLVGLVTFIALLILTPPLGMHVSILRLFVATAYTAAFSLSFGLIAFALQAASSVSRRFAAAAAVIIGFGGYILASLSGLTDWLRVPAKFAPFHYFNPEAILHGQPVHGLDIYLVGTLLICAVLAFAGFRRRDID